MLHMDDGRLTKQIFAAYLTWANSACKTWFFRVLEFYSEIGHDVICRDRDLSVRVVLTSVDSKLLQYYETQWQEKLNSDNAIRGPAAGGNKLRTYRTFKKHYCTEPYVEVITAKRYRSAYAKFRCGVAPIKIETCRYGLNRVPVDQRVCETCNVVEDEFHVIMLCSVFDDIRLQLMVSISKFNQDFKNLPLQEQFTQIMSNPLYYKIVSKAMHSILNRKHVNMYS